MSVEDSLMTVNATGLLEKHDILNNDIDFEVRQHKYNTLLTHLDSLIDSGDPNSANYGLLKDKITSMVAGNFTSVSNENPAIDSTKVDTQVVVPGNVNKDIINHPSGDAIISEHSQKTKDVNKTIEAYNTMVVGAQERDSVYHEEDAKLVQLYDELINIGQIYHKTNKGAETWVDSDGNTLADLGYIDASGNAMYPLSGDASEWEWVWASHGQDYDAYQIHANTNDFNHNVGFELKFDDPNAGNYGVAGAPSQHHGALFAITQEGGYTGNPTTYGPGEAVPAYGLDKNRNKGAIPTNTTSGFLPQSSVGIFSPDMIYGSDIFRNDIMNPELYDSFKLGDHISLDDLYDNTRPYWEQWAINKAMEDNPKLVQEILEQSKVVKAVHHDMVYDGMGQDRILRTEQVNKLQINLAQQMIDLNNLEDGGTLTKITGFEFGRTPTGAGDPGINSPTSGLMSSIFLTGWHGPEHVSEMPKGQVWGRFTTDKDPELVETGWGDTHYSYKPESRLKQGSLPHTWKDPLSVDQHGDEYWIPSLSEQAPLFKTLDLIEGKED